MSESIHDYEKPSVTVDTVIFTIKEKALKVILIKREVEPFKGKWALPGGFVKVEESLENATKRVLEQKTGVKDVYLEQLYSFGDLKRDPRGRVITISYIALINSKDIKLKEKDVDWFSVTNLPSLAFDHKKILEYALKRLKWKFEYTTVAFSLLPEKFTIGEIQEIYELVFEKEFDKRNFAKKILSLNILKEEEIKKDVSHRPPRLYSLKNKIGEIVEII